MKQLRILFIAEFGKPWNSGWWKKAGLEKNGHRVVHFDPAGIKDPVNRVVQLTEEFRPELILHLKDELSPSVFQELRKYAKVLQWHPDPVIPEWLPPYVGAADTFFTMSLGLLERFRKINPRSFWLTEAFEPSFFTIKKVSAEDIKALSAEVAFVGNLSSKTEYLPRRRLLQAVLHNGVKLKWWGPRMPRKLSTIPLLMGKLGRAYGGKFVWGETHAKISRLSKIYLGIDAMPHIRKSMSERMYIAVGCGAFYMCLHVDGIEEVLVPDREIVTFRSEEEMVDKIKYYLKHDDARAKIAEAGQRKVLEEHTYEVRMKQLVEMIEGGEAPR